MKSTKVASILICETCDYTCSKQSDYIKHLMTSKHKKLTNLNKDLTKNSHNCTFCKKEYKSRVGLWYHKNKCKNLYITESQKESKNDDVDALKNIVITCIMANGSVKSLLDTSLIAKNNNFTKSMVAQGSVGDVIAYTFTANDGNGQSASTKIVTTVIPIETALDGVSGQQVYNANSVGMPVAYNLPSSTAITTGVNGVKDILDKNTVGSAQWTKTWGSGNGTKFVKITANDYNNTEGTGYAYQLWKAYGSAAKDQITLVDGDCYLVKSGQDVPFGLFVVKITAVVDLPAAGNNNDYAQFDYKGIVLD